MIPILSPTFRQADIMMQQHRGIRQSLGLHYRESQKVKTRQTDLKTEVQDHEAQSQEPGIRSYTWNQSDKTTGTLLTRQIGNKGKGRTA